MDPTVTQLINFGSAGAVIVVVGLFLRFISSERVLDREMWSTHLTDTVRALERLGAQMESLIQTNQNSALSQRIRDELTASTLKKKDDLHVGERPATDKQ